MPFLLTPRYWRLVARLALVAALLSESLLAQDPMPKAMPQNPSPMVEHTRAHERLPERALTGVRLSLHGVLSAPIQIFIAHKAEQRRPFQLLIHFHGAPFVAEHAVSRASGNYILATVNLGPGSAAYDHAFSNPAVFDDVVGRIREGVGRSYGATQFSRIVLSAFSAGHGAVRAILREPRHAGAVESVLLLDGFHTGYVPSRTVLAEGGALDESQLAPVLLFARSALEGRKGLLITHSEIFPGTFASTTETADYVIRALGMRRVPGLEWGPLGMQQLSHVRQGRLLILGFAGNSAPDHVDHFHGMYHFLNLLEASR